MKTKKEGKINKGWASTGSAIKKDVGRRIQEIRKRQNHSAARIAAELGMTREGLTQIETGRNNVNAVLLWKLACLLGCKPEDFFPAIPPGFSLSRIDLLSIAKEDERAVRWAKDLFKNHG
jgi:transcriptional regulator with XRE-family HTH domain